MWLQLRALLQYYGGSGVLYKGGYNVIEDVWKAPIIQMNKTLGERNDLRCINMQYGKTLPILITI